MHLTITAYSTALFSTWINIEELGILFDAGDGVTSGLLQKSRKIKNVFISHPDRDHITGLIQLNQLNARDGFPKIYYPRDCGSFPAMHDFQLKFDPHIKGTEWKTLVDGSVTVLNNNYLVRAIRNEHIQAPQNISKSLSFKVSEVRKKVKTNYRELDSKAIHALIQEKGRDEVMEGIEQHVISYSGDTPVDVSDYEKWNGSNILIHEATFLPGEGDTRVESKGNKHSYLDEVLKMVSEIEVEQLVLNHFSSRYSKEEIDLAVRKLCKEYQIKIPVRLIYPGEIHRDLLNQAPVNSY